MKKKTMKGKIKIKQNNNILNAAKNKNNVVKKRAKHAAKNKRNAVKKNAGAKMLEINAVKKLKQISRIINRWRMSSRFNKLKVSKRMHAVQNNIINDEKNVII